MSDQTTARNGKLLKHASDIVAAYVSNNHVPPSELLGLIAGVSSALAGLSSGVPAPAKPVVEVEKATPAQIARSITPDALISFIDGKRYQMLKRHLTTHGLDESSYRDRYGLPPDYPITAPSYSELRSRISKQILLGNYNRR